jgi:hypothetical protein
MRGQMGSLCIGRARFFVDGKELAVESCEITIEATTKISEYHPPQEICVVKVKLLKTKDSRKRRSRKKK